MGSRRSLAKAIGVWLRLERRRAEMTQEQFAFKLGIHPVFLGEIERGQKAPSLATVEKVARVLHMKPHALIRAAEEHMGNA